MTVGWFSAQLRFRSKICNSSDHDPLCEESIRLIEAETETVAWAKAAAPGQASEHAYENDHGAHVAVRPSREMTFGEYQELLNTLPWI